MISEEGLDTVNIECGKAIVRVAELGELEERGLVLDFLDSDHKSLKMRLLLGENNEAKPQIHRGLGREDNGANLVEEVRLEAIQLWDQFNVVLLHDLCEPDVKYVDEQKEKLLVVLPIIELQEGVGVVFHVLQNGKDTCRVLVNYF